MYIPSHFGVDDAHEMYAFVTAHAFGQLVSEVDGRPFASHIPMQLSSDKTKLLGHVARSNPQHESLAGQQVLAIFSGEHDYVSPSWYEGSGVPTWNYQAVHIYGTVRTLESEDALRHIVEALTHTYEASLPEPWQPNFPEKMLGAIVGVEIDITQAQCKYKLSQNKSKTDRVRIADELEQLGSVELARAMRRAMDDSA